MATLEHSRNADVRVTCPQKISFGEMRESSVRGVLIYSSDYKCSHHIAISADQWPDDVPLFDSTGPCWTVVAYSWNPSGAARCQRLAFSVDVDGDPDATRTKL
jgi:hypothetical protein